MLDKIFIAFQYLIPHHLLSRLVGYFANCRLRWFKNQLISWFVKHYQVDMSLAVEPDIKKHETFNDFFTRKLDLTKREIICDKNKILSPIDGAISQIGHIQQNHLFQAKGKSYTLTALLGDEIRAAQFMDGEFATLYLSPKDYHRVHMSLDGVLKEMIYIPGKLFSVNPITTASVPNLFARNERAVCIFDTAIGDVAVILVGAMIVASINTVWAGKITPNKKNAIQRWQYPDNNISLKQAAELGHFELGSTVILLFQKDRIQWNESLSSDKQIKMGGRLGAIVT